jgi:co-chaperonin GroES (HSP10)
MRSAKNYVIIRVSAETDDTIKLSNGLILYQYTDQEDANAARNRRTYGEVVAVPEKLDLPPLRAIYEGSPLPTRYTGHEQIMNVEHRWRSRRMWNEERSDSLKKMYNPALAVEKYERSEHMQLSVGDKVYFHYLTIKNENWLGLLDDRKLFKVPYDQCFCAVRDGQIIMLNKNVLLTPYYDESYEEIEVANFRVKAKMKGDLAVSVKDEPEYMKGIHNGVKVLYRPVLDEGSKRQGFVNNIEGKEYFLMKEWDIVAQFDPLVPVGDYELLVPQRTESQGGVLFVNPKLTHTGTVMTGPLAGQEVIYNKGSKKNLWLREYERMLVHKEDIMAVVE